MEFFPGKSKPNPRSPVEPRWKNNDTGESLAFLPNATTVFYPLRPEQRQLPAAIFAWIARNSDNRRSVTLTWAGFHLAKIGVIWDFLVLMFLVLNLQDNIPPDHGFTGHVRWGT